MFFFSFLFYILFYPFFIVCNMLVAKFNDHGRVPYSGASPSLGSVDLS